MEPPPACRSAGIAALVPRNTPVALTSMTLVHSSTRSLLEPAGAADAGIVDEHVEPTEAARRGGDRACPVALAGDVEVDEERLGRPRRRARPPRGVPSASRRSPITTRAPSRAKSLAVAAPIPRAPPLMSATLPASRVGMPTSIGARLALVKGVFPIGLPGPRVFSPPVFRGWAILRRKAVQPLAWR